MSTKNINIVFRTDELCATCDVPAIFGDMEGNVESVTFVENGTSLMDILVQECIFPSRTQVKNNHWDKDIPNGFSEITIGRLKHQLTFWKPSLRCSEHS